MTDRQSFGSEVAVTHNSYSDSQLCKGARLGLGSRRTRYTVGAAVTQNEANTDTRVVSGGRRGSSVLAGERKGSSSHSEEWRGSGVLSGAREKATAVSCTWAREKTPKPTLL